VDERADAEPVMPELRVMFRYCGVRVTEAKSGRSTVPSERAGALNPREPVELSFRRAAGLK
jgi:hypothetical protein